jgi:hypothetical protein
MKKILLQSLAVLAIIVVASSCQYKFTVEPTVIPPDPGDTTLPKVSYNDEVQPIFDDRNCTGCHKPGQTKPDLTAGNSYNSIMSLGLADTSDPQASIIYQKPLPSGNHYAKYTSTDANTVLLWIGQGAMDN